MSALAAAEGPESVDAVFVAECAACHADLTGAEMQEMLPTAAEMTEDPDMILDLNDGMIAGAVFLLQEMGEAYIDAPGDSMINTAELHSPYMPPFVGTDEELEALVAYLSALARGDDPPPQMAGSGGAS
jgi:mono/diheme cytochrome c family protein